jgi:hypothetical protein
MSGGLAHCRIVFVKCAPERAPWSAAELAAALEIANKNKGGSKLPHSKGFASFDKNYTAGVPSPAFFSGIYEK